MSAPVNDIPFVFAPPETGAGFILLKIEHDAHQKDGTMDATTLRVAYPEIYSASGSSTKSANKKK